MSFPLQQTGHCQAPQPDLPLPLASDTVSGSSPNPVDWGGAGGQMLRELRSPDMDIFPKFVSY